MWGVRPSLEQCREKIAGGDVRWGGVKQGTVSVPVESLRQGPHAYANVLERKWVWSSDVR